MTATVTAKYDLKLWQIDCQSLPKQSNKGMKQPEGFVEPRYENHVAKLVHTIYGTMQGAHDWYETLSTTFDKPSLALIHAFNSRKQMGTIQPWIHTQMTYLELQMVMRKLRRGKVKLVRFGI